MPNMKLQTKFGANRSIIGLCAFKMAAAASLNFTESRILGSRMANVYRRTKFDANIFIGDRYMAEEPNPR